MSWGRIAAVGILFASLADPPTVPGQVQVEERPQILKPDRPLTHAEVDRKEADELFREARALFGVGVLRERSDRLLDALQLLERVVKLDPDAVPPRQALIPVYVALGRDEEALASCAAVLERDRADYETAYNRFKILKTAGRTREAAEALALGAASKRAEDRPDRLLIMLNELASLQEQAGEHPAAKATHLRIIRVFTDRREPLLLTGETRGDEIDASIALSYERVGRCCLEAREFAQAVDAFRSARDRFARHPDPQTRLQANRLNWNLSEACSAQEKWTEALAFLEAYLAQQPAGVEPYERQIDLLRRLGRAGEVIPAVRRAVARDPHHVGLRLLLARELGRAPEHRAEAERLYRDLIEHYPKADVYRGFFKLCESAGEPGKVLDLLDSAGRVLYDSKEDRPADEREAAATGLRKMLTVLKSEPHLVTALLAGALRELDAGPGRPERHYQTWRVLGALAARARQLEQAERLYRECLPLVRTNPDTAEEVYGGLIGVLWLAHKPEAVAALCRDALSGPNKLPNVNGAFFQQNLAQALSELGRTDEALTQIELAIKNSSAEEAKVSQRLRKVVILRRAERFEPALAECKSMLAELTRAALIRGVRLELSQVYLEMAEPAKSEEQLRLLVESDPNDALACNNLGYQMADRSRDLDEAERLIRRAIEVDRLQRQVDSGEDAENAAYLDSLGWVLFRKGQAREAKDWLEKAAALAQGAEDPTVWDHLGDVYLKLDEPAKARRAWESAVKLYSHELRAKKEGRLSETQRKLKLLAAPSGNAPSNAQ